MRRSVSTDHALASPGQPELVPLHAKRSTANYAALRWARTLAAAISLSLLASGAVSNPAHIPESDEHEAELLVMLQGDDLKTISENLVASGATITHQLPIINAVGARMSRAQLEIVEAGTPQLRRVIDDLAYEAEPKDDEDRNDCGLAGSLELRWSDSVARWALFNKSDRDLNLESIHLTWPETLGELRTVKLESKLLKLNYSQRREVEALVADDTSAGLPAGSETAIYLDFSKAPQTPFTTQRAIALRAQAGADCSTKLAPSYDAPGEDSYYATVSGAALLHSHGVTGTNITVAVLDSGLWEHPELATDTAGKNRIVARYDAIHDLEPEEAFDESGHGTHMTSVLARSRPATRQGADTPSYHGIAPDARLVVVKAFDHSGEAGFLDIVRGVQWVLDNREAYDIRILNLSFSARPRWPYWDDPINQALMRAWEAGIFIVAAAGNEGPEPMTVGSPGNLPYILTVGAITDSWTEYDHSDDYIPDFSSRGPTPMGHIKPDIVAPGGHMSGLVRPGSSLLKEFPEYLLSNGEFVMTGTSQASALVSGIAALLLQLEPGLSNNALKCMLTSSAQPAIEADGRLAYSPFQQGSGLMNVQRALTLGETDCANAGLSLEQDMANSDHFSGPAVFAENAPPSLPGQHQLISDHESEKGASVTRRWGARAHVERMTDPDAPSPIDWLNVVRDEIQRMEAITRDAE
ncbi:MAG: serine protease AprX [Halieaceae bacterium]|jgi:serine protease AprX